MEIKLIISTTEIIKPKKGENIKIYFENSYFYPKNFESPVYIQRIHEEIFNFDILKIDIENEDDFYKIISTESGYNFANENNELAEESVIISVIIDGEIHWIHY